MGAYGLPGALTSGELQGGCVSRRTERMAFHRNALQLNIWRSELREPLYGSALQELWPPEDALHNGLIVERRLAINTFINR